MFYIKRMAKTIVQVLKIDRGAKVSNAIGLFVRKLNEI